MARFVRNSLYLLALVGGLTFSAGLVVAQAAPSVIPVNITPSAATPAGLQTMATYQASGAGAANGYYSRPVLVSNSTLGGLARGLARRAVPVAAMLAAIEAAGWVIDELTGQVMSGPPAQTTIPAGGSYWIDSVSGYVHATAADAGNYMGSVYGGYTFQSVNWCTPGTLPTLQHCNALLTKSGGYELNPAVTQYQNGATPRNITGPIAHPSAVPDSALGGLVKNDPNLWNQALRNPDGSVNRNPDVMAGADALRQSLLDPDPAQQPNPGAEWDTGEQGGEPQPGGASELEFPEFCTWAAIVCTMAEYVLDDSDEGTEDDAMPVIDVDLSATTWDSGLGGGSCPPDVVVSDVMGGEVVFPLSGFCAAAEVIRPLVLAGAALLALFIVGGFRRAS